VLLTRALNKIAQHHRALVEVIKRYVRQHSAERFSSSD
jgi:hypothetical protein